jgi:hypothetical protein
MGEQAGHDRGGCPRLESDEVRNNNERDAYRDENIIAGHKVRKDHQGEAAGQGYDGSLLLAVQEEAEPD